MSINSVLGSTACRMHYVTLVVLLSISGLRSFSSDIFSAVVVVYRIHFVARSTVDGGRIY